MFINALLIEDCVDPGRFARDNFVQCSHLGFSGPTVQPDIRSEASHGTIKY